MARRARIILACADGQQTTGIAKRLHVSPTTVCKWRTRFLTDRVDGLVDEPRPGTPRRSPSPDWLDDIDPLESTNPATPAGARWWTMCCTQAKLALPFGGAP